MGAASSKIEDDKALILCRERRRFVRQALDGRCSLAASHVAYIQSLRNTGISLRKFVQPEVTSESSLYTTSTSATPEPGISLRKFVQPEVTSESSLYTTSTSATPEPLALTEKSTSQFSNSSASPSQHVETSETFSLTPSPPMSARFHVNHMKAGHSDSKTIEERPPVPVTATTRRSPRPPKRTDSYLDESFEAPPPPDSAPWDYFGLFHPIDNQLSFHDGKGLSHELENTDDIGLLREEEGIPGLEEEGEKASTNERGGHDRRSDDRGSDDKDDDDSMDSMDSEDEFDQPSTEPLVRMYRNRNEVLDDDICTDALPDIPSTGSIASEAEQQNGDKTVHGKGLYGTDDTSEVTPSKTASSVVTLSVNGKEKESFRSENKLPVKDFFAGIKEIEDLFLNASDSGREVARMLEADKVQFRPLFPHEIAHKSNASTILTACFTCFTEEVHPPQAPASNEVKYLTWHRSASSRSSSSRNPLAPTSKDEVDDLSSNLFSSICMNSGSHASTLDRLYAWERKLYDEVKASGMIRREYDMKCKLLRDQDSRGESPHRIDRTRASVKDLHSRIRVAIHRIDSISKTIETIRDLELQPQLEELIGGLTRMWRKMLECHENQYDIMTAAASTNNGRTKLSSSNLSSESHRQATILLQMELTSLCSTFTKWMSSHESYLESINGWLHKCIFLNPIKQKRRKAAPFSPRRDVAPPIFVTCREWLILLKELPTKEVVDAVKDLVDATAHFLPRQEKTHGKNREGNYYKELDRNENVVDMSLNYDILQSGLVVFLDRLKTFAEASVGKYDILHSCIAEARAAYARADNRS